MFSMWEPTSGTIRRGGVMGRNADGVLPIAYNPQGDSRNGSLVPGKEGGEARLVPLQRLDEYIQVNISCPERIKCIKIDVEGFE